MGVCEDDNCNADICFDVKVTERSPNDLELTFLLYTAVQQYKLVIVGFEGSRSL